MDLVLIGGTILSKSLIQFSVAGPGCVPSLLFNLRPNCGGGNEDQALLSSVPLTLQQATIDPTPLWETPGHSCASLGQSLVGSLLLFPGFWCTQAFICAFRESVSPVLCKFWRLYGAVNGDLLQEGLWHTQVYCTQSPRSCGRPLLTHTFAGNTQTYFWPVSVGSLGPGAHKVCFTPLLQTSL